MEKDDDMFLDLDNFLKEVKPRKRTGYVVIDRKTGTGMTEEQKTEFHRKLKELNRQKAMKKDSIMDYIKKNWHVFKASENEEDMKDGSLF